MPTLGRQAFLSSNTTVCPATRSITEKEKGLCRGQGAGSKGQGAGEHLGCQECIHTMANSPGTLGGGGGLGAVIIDPISVPDFLTFTDFVLGITVAGDELSEPVALNPGMESSMAIAMYRPHSQLPLKLAVGDSSGQ